MELSGNIIPIPQIFHRYTTYLSKSNFKIFSHFSRKTDNVKLQNTFSFLEYYHFKQSALFETYRVGFLTMWYHATEIWRSFVAGGINKL